MSTTGLNLLISDKPDVERDAVAESFVRGGGEVTRVGRFWDPPAFEPATVRVYGADSFCLVLQQKLGLTLCSPHNELLLRLPTEFLRRQIVRSRLEDVPDLSLPAFIKPIIPKQFRAAVYATPAEIWKESEGLAPDTAIFVSEVVTFAAEARAFVLQGEVLDAAVYEGGGDVEAVESFVTELAKTDLLPRTVVVDVGLIRGRGWAVIEFNAAWGSGLNGCDPMKVLPAIVAASDPTVR